MTKQQVIKLFHTLFVPASRSFAAWVGLLESLLVDEEITARQVRSWKLDYKHVK